MTVPEIQASEVPDDAYLLDVREQVEWVSGHAPKAVHIPLGELQARVDEVPAGETVYVICRVGGRSYNAAAWLNHIGRQAVNVDGGMQAWDAARLPMVSETGHEPFVG
ncbi:rhodanese-like domain-containing protein [Nonomuraea soli]|uniref:Rhodanese-related sulfurtransferase n=1 Tax=Nonomuraea soli TaxID=1032476 RepID=A0A7W0HQ97_9ACTN|nr:rhodanese-like domain-containing protein [Nonomuraea soli]MBA2891683.1 rhodanese-related sulfurtransferase [Nonomuraea soli]